MMPGHGNDLNSYYPPLNEVTLNSHHISNQKIRVNVKDCVCPKGNLWPKFLLLPGSFLLSRAIGPVKLLTHWRQVTRICIGRLTIVSHYLTQRWNNVDWTLGTIFNPVLFIFIQKNAFQNVVWKMVAILSWPHCVAYTIPAMICTVIVYRTGVMVSIDVTIHILCWPFKMLSRGYNSSICNLCMWIIWIGCPAFVKFMHCYILIIYVLQYLFSFCGNGWPYGIHPIIPCAPGLLVPSRNIIHGVNHLPHGKHGHQLLMKFSNNLSRERRLGRRDKFVLKCALSVLLTSGLHWFR